MQPEKHAFPPASRAAERTTNGGCSSRPAWRQRKPPGAPQSLHVLMWTIRPPNGSQRTACPEFSSHKSGEAEWSTRRGSATRQSSKNTCADASLLKCRELRRQTDDLPNRPNQCGTVAPPQFTAHCGLQLRETAPSEFATGGARCSNSHHPSLPSRPRSPQAVFADTRQTMLATQITGVYRPSPQARRAASPATAPPSSRLCRSGAL